MGPQQLQLSVVKLHADFFVGVDLLLVSPFLRPLVGPDLMQQLQLPVVQAVVGVGDFTVGFEVGIATVG